MTLLLTLLPLYLLGNFHCVGMCGPLVLMLGQHRFRYFYFLGRTISFSLAGFLAGAFGAVIQFYLKHYYVSALACLLTGILFCIVGLCGILGRSYPGSHWLAKITESQGQTLSMLLLRDKPWPCFLFGFFTLLLPCGQTIVVFSACALSGDPLTGFINGFAFAFLTSPALFFSMKAHSLFRYLRKYYQGTMGTVALCLGVLLLFRGLADLGAISHMVLNPESAEELHIILW